MGSPNVSPSSVIKNFGVWPPDLTKFDQPTRLSLLDLPHDVLYTILSKLHHPHHIVNRRSLRELEGIAALAMTCQTFRKLVHSIYSTKFEVFDPSPLHTFKDRPYLGPLGTIQYPVLYVLPYLFSTNLRKVRLSPEFCTGYLETFLQSLSQACPNINELSFRHPPAPNPYYLFRLNEFPSLSVLEVEAPSNTILGFLEHYLPKLKKLTLLRLPVSLLACVHHSMIARVSRLKHDRNYQRLEELYISVQTQADMDQDDFLPFYIAVRKQCGEYLMYLKHFHISRKGWRGDLRHLIRNFQSGHSWFLPNLKFEISERSDRYMRGSKSVIVGSDRLTSKTVTAVAPLGGDLFPEDEIKTVIQKLEKAEAFVISNSFLKSLVRYTTLQRTEFLNRLREIQGVNELIWDFGQNPDRLNVESVTALMSEILRSLPGIRCFKVYVGGSYLKLAHLFAACENVEAVCLFLSSIPGKRLDAEVQFLVSVTKELRTHSRRLKCLVVEMHPMMQRTVSKKSFEALKSQIEKLETHFPLVDLESVRFWLDYSTTVQN